MTNKNKIEVLLAKLKIQPRNFSVFENAFVHRSYLNENKSFKHESNERLEFLGDAVLELSATEYLYKKYNFKEGELTSLRSALVRGNNLSHVAKELGLYECLYLSSGERKSSGKAKDLILANTLEALIGAIYLDLGMEVATKFIKEMILKHVEKILNEKLYIDPKSDFQEKVQETYKETPRYETLSESGPDHNKIFVSGVYISDRLIAKGEGSSKSEAEQKAAECALGEI